MTSKRRQRRVAARQEEYAKARAKAVCGQKKGYPSQAAAKQAAGFLRGAFKAKAVHAYACPNCEQWHVGHAIGTNQKANPFQHRPRRVP